MRFRRKNVSVGTITSERFDELFQFWYVSLGHKGQTLLILSQVGAI